MELAEAFRHALDGRSILFVGSGFSRGAKARKDVSFKTGLELAAYFTNKLGLKGKLDLDIAADIFQARFGVPALIALLKDIYTVSSFMNDHALIACLPWRRIFTTNYDNIIQEARHRSGIKATTMLIDDEPSHYHPDTIGCLHINGHIDQLNEQTIFSKFKLTRTSYLTEDFRSSRWAFTFRDDIDLARSVIFIGYSLYDLDLARILFENAIWKKKCVFITGPDPSDGEKHILRKFGKVFPIGLDGAARECRDVKKTHKPLELVPIFHSFERYEPSAKTPSLDDDARYDLLLRGNSDFGLIRYSLNQPQTANYYVKRTMTDAVITEMLQGSKFIVIHSNLGNGKSLFIEGLMVAAANQNFECFRLLRERFGIEKELVEISKLNGPKIVIVENYDRHYTVLRLLFSISDPSTVVVLSARTGIHEVNADHLSELTTKEYTEVDLNRLDNTELESFSRVLDTSGLWGENAGLKNIQKQALLRTVHHSELQSILLGVINSPEIIGRLQSLVDAMDDDVRRLIVAGLISEILNFDSTLAFLAEAVGISAIPSLARLSDAAMKEFVSVSGARLRVRSSVLASVVVRQLEQGDLVLETMIRITEQAGSLRATDYTMRELFRQIMMYSNVDRILPDHNKALSLVNFYESVKNVSGNSGSPHYWLQYAIARLSIPDFEKAGLFFENAYGQARTMPRFNPFHIDNHYARYLLERTIFYNDLTNSFSAFQAAHEKLYKQATSLRTYYYPYRVAANYLQFFNLFYSSWTRSEKKRFEVACRALLQRMDELRIRLRAQRHIVACRANLSEILQRL